jgi:hypothetical protein
LSCKTALEEDLARVDMMQESPWEWDIDFAEHLDCFEGVLEDDPNNPDALLMAAFCRLMVTGTNEELGDIMDDLFDDGSKSARHNALFWYLNRPDMETVRNVIQKNVREDFIFSDIQDFIVEEVIPSLDEIDAYLTLFEEMDVVVTLDPWAALPDSLVPPDSLGIPDYLEFDATDAYFAHVPVDAMQSMCYMVVSYNVDTLEDETLEYLIDEDSDFLTLNSGDHMNSAYDELMEAADHLDDACDALEGETDDQAYDFITVSESGWIPLEDDDLLGPGAVDSLRNAADMLRDALTDEMIINPSEHDPSAPDMEIHVSLDSMFNNPLEDLRDYFPEHTWSVAGDTMYVTEPLTRPDPTFNGPDTSYDGIFPGMTNEDWRLLYDWEEPNWR